MLKRKLIQFCGSLIKDLSHYLLFIFLHSFSLLLIASLGGGGNEEVKN